MSVIVYSAVFVAGGDGTGLNKRVEQLDAQVADLKLSVSVVGSVMHYCVLCS